MVFISNVQLWLGHDRRHMFHGQFRPERQCPQLHRSIHIVKQNTFKWDLLTLKLVKPFFFYINSLSKNGTIKAVLQNQFPISQFQTGEFKVPGFDLKVVDTDYKSYILWHACISDPSSGVDLFERIVVATRSLDEVGLFKYWFYDGLIEKKIFNNNKKVAFHVTPYGRCNCDKI